MNRGQSRGLPHNLIDAGNVTAGQVNPAQTQSALQSLAVRHQRNSFISRPNVSVEIAPSFAQEARGFSTRNLRN
jgi:hypothetical protein